jgi:divinyl protochlorophyllide a 8-vinyl-reductase
VSAAAARIGPNAISRVIDALRADGGEAMAHDVLASVGLARYLRAPPEQMVAEAEVARLHQALRRDLLPARAQRVARLAGAATGDYLLAHRIPKPVQALLRLLPAPLACRLLLAAIRRHAWTFAGSGRFVAVAGRPARLAITGNPLCRDAPRSAAPQCDYYAATFERLFRVLVHPRSTAVEVACEARGDDACRFEIGW